MNGLRLGGVAGIFGFLANVRPFHTAVWGGVRSGSPGFPRHPVSCPVPAWGWAGCRATGAQSSLIVVETADYGNFSSCWLISKQFQNKKERNPKSFLLNFLRKVLNTFAKVFVSKRKGTAGNEGKAGGYDGGCVGGTLPWLCAGRQPEGLCQPGGGGRAVNYFLPV